MSEKRSLRLKEQVVTVDGEDGHERRFTIRELDGAGRAIAVEATRERVVVNGQHLAIRDAGTLDLIVLALSLHDESGNLVARAVLDKFPGSLIAKWGRVSADLSELPRLDREDARGNA